MEVLFSVPYFEVEEVEALATCPVNKGFYQYYYILLLHSTVTGAFLVEGFL